MKTIKHHESKYFHIKKSVFNLIWKIPLALIPFILSVLNLYYGIIQNWSYLKLDLLIIPMLFFEFALIAGSFIFLVYLIKGKLKSYNEGGLISGLIGRLIVGLIYGLIVGLISGLIVGLIDGLIVGLIEEDN